ncbi:MAG TPA: hypothetical protein VMM83_04260 [Longimicrobiales bacterium]|nr:hypothetical protein [Longimicrobiales bacterium]
MTGESRLRTALAAIFYFGAIGTIAELVLLGHFEEPLQFAPSIALILAALALGWALARPSPRILYVTRWTMLLLLVVAAVGVVLHYRANMEIELEMAPYAGGLPLLWLALRGGTPALAPGLMAHLGLIGFLYTYGHPALERDTSNRENTS